MRPGKSHRWSLTAGSDRPRLERHLLPRGDAPRLRLLSTFPHPGGRFPCSASILCDGEGVSGDWMASQGGRRGTEREKEVR